MPGLMLMLLVLGIFVLCILGDLAHDKHRRVLRPPQPDVQILPQLQFGPKNEQDRNPERGGCHLREGRPHKVGNKGLGNAGARPLGHLACGLELGGRRSGGQRQGTGLDGEQGLLAEALSPLHEPRGGLVDFFEFLGLGEVEKPVDHVHDEQA